MADHEETNSLGRPTESSREALRQTFNADALKYDRARPGYPADVFDHIAKAGSLDSFETTNLAGEALARSGGRVLEIGSGTGQATRSMFARGWRITAVELGAELARVGRSNADSSANGNPNAAHNPRGHVTVITGDIETVDRSSILEAGGCAHGNSTDEGFDAVVAFTCFHWLNPATRAGLVASYLRPGGLAAVVDTHHVANKPGDPSERFFIDSQVMHARYMPEADGDKWLSTVEDIAPRLGSLSHPGLSALDEHQIIGEIVYSADAYIDLLGTYSGHLALAEVDRLRLFAEISHSINTDYGGAITKRYLYTISLARKI